MLTRALNTIYRAAGVLAGVFLVSICVIVTAQIVARQFEMIIPSADQFAGFCLAATSFLGLAYSFRSGSHIRVTLFVQTLGRTGFRIMLIVALTIAMGISGLLAWHTIQMVAQNFMRSEVTSGLVSIPLWLPQIGMAVGLTLFAIAIVEDLVSTILGRPTIFSAAKQTGTGPTQREDGPAGS